MWVPGRAAPRVQRTPSVHSISSMHSPSTPKASTTNGFSNQSARNSTYNSSDDGRSDAGRLSMSAAPAPWQSNQPEPIQSKLIVETRTANHQAINAAPRWETATDDDVSSRSSTLDGEEDYMQHVEKKQAPRLLPRKDVRNEEPRSPAPAPHVPGPLESQLAALMSKLIYLEHSNPAVSINPDEYAAMQKRLNALEEEKKTWWKRHDAIWALRDEDVENNIKIRGMLAKCRRELEETKALRDEDLVNVQIVRSKLAEKTRELERMSAQTGRSSPSRGRPASFFERRGTTSDLFTAAKTAALEQRALELEKRNSDLVAQVETLKGGANIDDLNRFTAHKAWKDTVGDLESKVKAKDAELSRLRSGAGGSTGGVGMDWYRVEALLEEHAGYRETVGGKLQALRSDKESLQKELHRKENECQSLELRLQTMQRRSTVL